MIADNSKPRITHSQNKMYMEVGNLKSHPFDSSDHLMDQIDDGVPMYDNQGNYTAIVKLSAIGKYMTVHI